jgi:MFS family permease
MMAACANVETFAAAQVFYWVGFNGMAYVLDVFMADTSSLKNRALVFAFSTTPYIVTTFIGPRAAQSFLETSGWHWGYGVFAIITPVIAVPILAVLWRNQKKAVKRGLLVQEKSGRTFGENVSHWFWEFDGKLPGKHSFQLPANQIITVIGLLLIIAAFSLILLPVSLANYQRAGWGSATIIAMLVVGGVCLIAFPIYEKWVSRKSFIPFHLLTDRSVVGACLLAAFLFISF